MSRTPALFAALVLLAAGLAGCVSEEPEAAVDLTNTTVETDCEFGELPNGQCFVPETNATEEGLGGEEHAHDYWLGRDRVVIGEIQSGLIPLPLTPADGNGKQYTPGTAIADFKPPAPNLVYEGTAKLEVVMNRVSLLTPGAVPDVDHPAAHFNFQYLTSKDGFAQWREGGALVPGQPVVLDVASDEVDMPHATASLWVFRFYTDEPTAVEFNATITAVRGADVVEWPGHPDFYAEKTRRVILDADAQTKSYGVAKYLVTGEDASWTHPEKLISYGTRELHVFVNFTKVEGQQTPDRYFLELHNATVYPGIGDLDPGQEPVTDDASDGKSYHFVVPVDEGGMDSPYSPSSRWGFRVLGATGEADRCGLPGGIAIATSCLEYTVDYHITIIAVGESTALGV